MAKRGNGEGTIYYSETLKKWVGQFTAGRKADGKLNRKSVYGNTRKEVKEKITKALADVQSKNFIDTNSITVSELAKKIIDRKYETNNISPSTYARNLKTYKIIENEIGNYEIQKITPDDLQNFLNQHKEYSNSYIDKIYMMLNQTFKEAINEDIIYKNPLERVLKPKSNKKDNLVEAFTVDEQKKFTDYITNSEEQYKNIFLILLYTGMRVGELLSLTLDNIDLENNIIHINRTLTKDKNGKVKIGETTKTYNSTRDIPITSLFKDILKDCISNYIPNKEKLLFVHPNGNLIYPSTINTQFKKECKHAKIKVITRPITRLDKNNKEKIINVKSSSVNTHMLRHTFATRCIEAGMQAVVLQKLLGHKDIQTTLNTYTSVFNKFKEKEIDKYIEYINQLH